MARKPGWTPRIRGKRAGEVRKCQVRALCWLTVWAPSLLWTPWRTTEDDWAEEWHPCLKRLSLVTMWRAERMEAKPEMEPAGRRSLWSRQQLMRAEMKTVRLMGGLLLAGWKQHAQDLGKDVRRALMEGGLGNERPLFLTCVLPKQIAEKWSFQRCFRRWASMTAVRLW